MPELNLRHLSTNVLRIFNLLGKTSLKKHHHWKLRPHMAYVEKNGVHLHCDVYVPDYPGPKPAVLVVHGGGWYGRSRRDTRFYAEQLANNGFVVVNCTYRFAPANLYPAALEDIRDCYHWMIKHAHQFEIDPKRVGAMGYSAGAHLLSLVSAWASLGKKGYEDVHFKAVVAGGGVYDFMVYPFSPYIHRFTSFYRDENIELYKEASPIHQLGTKLPHFFLFHSIKDELVEHDQMVRFQKAIQEKGGKAEIHTVPRLSHRYTFVFALGAVEKGIRFLKERL